MSQLILLSICSIYLGHLVYQINGHSIQFGCLHPAAVPIYEVDLSWKSSVYYMQFFENATNQSILVWTKNKMKFIINQIMVFDESPLVSNVQTEIIQGGVGFNFTTLRMSCFQSEESEVRSAKVTILIYGVSLSQT